MGYRIVVICVSRSKVRPRRRSYLFILLLQIFKFFLETLIKVWQDCIVLIN
jgi:hypothetical protein